MNKLKQHSIIEFFSLSSECKKQSFCTKYFKCQGCSAIIFYPELAHHLQSIQALLWSATYQPLSSTIALIQISSYLICDEIEEVKRKWKRKGKRKGEIVRDERGVKRERKRQRERERRRLGSEKCWAFWPHFTALNYHNSCVKAGIENSAGQSWGQHSPQYSISNHYTYSPINYTSHST